MDKIYGVSQMNHGHEYRWIFKESVIRKTFDEDIEMLDGECIRFPIGGSNVSATWFEELDTDDAVRDFLTRPGDGPGLDDPQLADIGEYLLTVSGDYESITEQYVNALGIPDEMLEQWDDADKHKENVERMSAVLKKLGYHDFECDNPFYGKNREMRYSDFCELYESVVKAHKAGRCL